MTKKRFWSLISFLQELEVFKKKASDSACDTHKP